MQEKVRSEEFRLWKEYMLSIGIKQIELQKRKEEEEKQEEQEEKNNEGEDDDDECELIELFLNFNCLNSWNGNFKYTFLYKGIEISNSVLYRIGEDEYQYLARFKERSIDIGHGISNITIYQIRSIGCLRSYKLNIGLLGRYYIHFHAEYRDYMTGFVPDTFSFVLQLNGKDIFYNFFKIEAPALSKGWGTDIETEFDVTKEDSTLVFKLLSCFDIQKIHLKY